MLLNQFYTLLKQESESNKVSALISFNPSHKIFEGHFPGHPVVPGVCMMQIVREVMEVEAGQKLKISKGDNMKFLAVINPLKDREVQLLVTYSTADDLFNLNATLVSGTVTFFKFKGTFQKV
jgi:3-hydroxyacyl-[acyl-carrier-protein] dehydratase